MPTMANHIANYCQLQVALLVSLTVCLVIFILLVTFAYLRYKHREDRRQRYMAESGVR